MYVSPANCRHVTPRLLPDPSDPTILNNPVTFLAHFIMFDRLQSRPRRGGEEIYSQNFEYEQKLDARTELPITLFMSRSNSDILDPKRSRKKLYQIFHIPYSLISLRCSLAYPIFNLFLFGKSIRVVSYPFVSP
jgi:hypothetical protein